MLHQKQVFTAYQNIKDFVKHTPIVSSRYLNESLGHEIYFKLENIQKTGSFKLRGVINSLLDLKNNNKLPKKFTAYSTGNHGIGLAYACQKFGVELDLFLPCFTSEIKQIIAQKYGANVISTKTREEAEKFSKDRANERPDYFFLPPSDHDGIIAGAATIAYETFAESNYDATFVPIGGGGLAAGTLLAQKLTQHKGKLILAEPSEANDVSKSISSGKIFRFSQSPQTIADGAKTLGISQKIFEYVKQYDELFEISEREISYWNAWFMHLTKFICEPTSALGIAAAYRWLKKQKTKRKILVIITGGNLDSTTYHKIWASNHLLQDPSNFIFDEE